MNRRLENFFTKLKFKLFKQKEEINYEKEEYIEISKLGYIGFDTKYTKSSYRYSEYYENIINNCNHIYIEIKSNKSNVKTILFSLADLNGVRYIRVDKDDYYMHGSIESFRKVIKSLGEYDDELHGLLYNTIYEDLNSDEDATCNLPYNYTYKPVINDINDTLKEPDIMYTITFPLDPIFRQTKKHNLFLRRLLLHTSVVVRANDDITSELIEGIPHQLIKGHSDSDINYIITDMYNLLNYYTINKELVNLITSSKKEELKRIFDYIDITNSEIDSLNELEEELDEYFDTVEVPKEVFKNDIFDMEKDLYNIDPENYI